MSGRPTDRSQSGLDRLLLFVVAVVALVFLAPYALGLLGVDVRGGGGGSPTPSDHDLTILAARGEAIADDRSSVGAVRLVVVPNHGRTPVDLGDGTAIWVDDRSHHLGPAGTSPDAVDGAYRVAAADGSTPVLETTTERGVVVFDLGTDDVDGVGEFGDRLRAGETASVTLVTPDGETLTRELAVPDPIPAGAEEVWL